MKHKVRKRFFSAILREDQDALGLILGIKEQFDVPVFFIDDIESFVRLSAKDIILEEGVSSITSYSTMYAEVLPPTKPLSGLIDILKAMLDKLDVQSSLTIIDRYLFPEKHDKDYVDNLLFVISGSIPENVVVRVVIGERSNKKLLKEFKFKLNKMKPNSEVQVVYTDEYHDRFWISDEDKGLFVGTSLNGIGKKYSMVDYLSKKDAQEIYDSLSL
ncbi:hypothetical protein P3589_23185 [Vibrio parahaemolyticus]|uniref:hypothetical protein n=1 Tax=Vibrio parahaemolyticus TaxID=670 RepID=UPI00111EE577|nr:hypothetical protein [Vibrio parahaemolyticus]EGS6501235.1 hypothetical protein [Vibrio parahaemolyticus]EHH1241976.1 hypothetical protein [Vibrio parahaemolyticus]ELF4880217.1 hypothetical protein [Vibrio parahaemolyticus]MDF5014864.1 hypothetical protein [Vibrio parahaemolyticus]TOE04531.1 hypothetical protein CGJ50_23290 [Vibrio parahaemolyticus]